jgi:hypothetical protein
MAHHYIGIIAQGLKQWDTMNHGHSNITLEHYRAIAWGGLKETNYYLLIFLPSKKGMILEITQTTWSHGHLFYVLINLDSNEIHSFLVLYNIAFMHRESNFPTLQAGHRALPPT